MYYNKGFQPLKPSGRQFIPRPRADREEVREMLHCARYDEEEVEDAALFSRYKNVEDLNMHTQPNHNQMVTLLLSNLTALLRAHRMPFAISVQDDTTGTVTCHSYCPPGSSVRLVAHVCFEDNDGPRRPEERAS